LVDGGLTPTLDWQTVKEVGAQEETSARPTGWKYERMGIIDLVDEPRNQAEYRVGTPNFFAITHYNRSYFYAAAVAELARILANRLDTRSISRLTPPHLTLQLETAMTIQSTFSQVRGYLIRPLISRRSTLMIHLGHNDPKQFA